MSAKGRLAVGSGPRRHHAVPVSYQRAWADAGQILLVDKATLVGTPVGPKDAFVSKDLFTVRADDGTPDLTLEHHFARMESVAMPGVRRYIAGAADEAAAQCVKLLMATAFARGRAIEAHSRDFVVAEKPGVFADVLSQPKLVPLFRQDFGRDPSEGELLDLLESNWERSIGQNRMYVDTVARAHNYAVEKFRESHLQRLIAPPSTAIGFLSGDTPLVHAQSAAGLRVGVLEGLALGDASLVYFPLSPRVAVCLHGEPGTGGAVAVATGQRLHRKFIERAANRWLLASPSMDVHRSLARSAR